MVLEKFDGDDSQHKDVDDIVANNETNQCKDPGVKADGDLECILDVEPIVAGTDLENLLKTLH